MWNVGHKPSFERVQLRHILFSTVRQWVTPQHEAGGTTKTRRKRQ